MLNAQRILLTVGCLLCFGLIRQLWNIAPHSSSPFAVSRNLSSSLAPAINNTVKPSNTDLSAICPPRDGLEDVLIVLKTGATEIYEKLPIHLATTFACISDYLIYSDVAQLFGSLQVHDALAYISPEVREQHNGLVQYRRLQQYVQAGADAAELKGEQSWGLDKWKFLPMISDAFRRFEMRKKWYIFVEADTYISMHNLRLWLQQLDSSRAVYAGAQVMIGATEFAHGGSGFLLSAPAAKGIMEVYGGNRQHWEYRVADECCGDKLMAEALLKAQSPVRLHRSFPIIQGETLTSLDWSPTHWCRPAVSWHHVDAAGIDRLWQFERKWRNTQGPDMPILFSNYFAAFIEPRITAANGTMPDWDNLSNDWVFEQGKIVDSSYMSATACERFCRRKSDCLQWAWSPGLCRGGKAIRLGWALSNRPALGSAEDRIAQAGSLGTKGAVSGWLLDRIAEFKEQQGSCKARNLWDTHVD